MTSDFAGSLKRILSASADAKAEARPIIYFAGVNTNPVCEAFAGLHVLESFADIRNLLDRHRPLFKSMCLDSGAYSVMTTGKSVSLREYIKFAKAHGGFYDFVASLDSIGGSAEENLVNLEKMRDAGIDAMPTYHSGEPVELLRKYCASSSRVGLGVVRPNGKMPPSASVREFLKSSFAEIPASVRVHGWGMTNYTNFPFHSVDSTTWLWEVKALLSTKGQGAEALACLTPRECIEIVQKKYLRYGKRQAWGDFNESNNLENL
jgi:hypothetical protein